MTALTANLELQVRDGLEVEIPVLAAETIYEGAPVMVTEAGGFAYSPDGTTNVLTLGDIFAGICLEKVDNSAGSSGDKFVKVLLRGLVRVPVTGTLSQAKLGDPVYFNDTSDDSTFTLTPDPTELNVQLGNFTVYDASSSYGWVMVDGYTMKKMPYDQFAVLPAHEGMKRVKLMKFNYSFAVDGGAVSAITIGHLPSGAIVLGGVIDITTTLTSGGSATIAIDSEGAGDLKSATAVASWTAGRLALNASTTFAASSVKTTAARNVTATIATAALTAGVFDLYLLVANI